MRLIDCFWEEKNLGKRTVEILIEKTDRFNKELMAQVLYGYEYVVVKVPMNMPDFNINLCNMGFACIESQMNVGISLREFDLSKVSLLYNDTSFEPVENEAGFNSVISNMQPGMFSTDRITIDSKFGESIGCQRYINWMTEEYNRNKSRLIKILYKKEHIGFMLIKIDDKTINLLLNGLYKPYQGKGLGILTPASPIMYARKNQLQIVKEETCISSNNVPVVKLYNRLGFQIIQQSYVFIKHFQVPKIRN